MKSRRASTLVRVLAVSCLCVFPQPSTAGAAAQARNVGVAVRTSPALPQPGSDVLVDVAVSACPNGPAVIEAYLTFGATSARSVALVAKGRADQTFLGIHRGVLRIPKAFEGTYGVRAACGSYVPEQVPLPNTLFPVGSPIQRSAVVDTTSVRLGSPFNLSGNGCAGSTVEYDFDRTGNSQAPFQVEGVIPVNADQTWTGPVLPDPRLEPGKVALRVRCVLTNQYGTSIYVYYSDRIEIDLTEETPTSV